MLGSSQRVALCFLLLFAVQIISLGHQAAVTSAQSEVEIRVSEDTYVESDRSEIRGLQGSLEVRYSTSGEFSYTFLKFDLSAIPANSRIVSIHLTVTTSRVFSPLFTGSYLTQFAGWSESSLTWSEAGFAGQISSEPSDSFLVSQSGRSFEFDLTPNLDLIEGARLFTVILRPTRMGAGASSGVIQFYSKDQSAADFVPKILVTFEAGQTSATTTQHIQSTATGPGVQGQEGSLLGQLALPIGGVAIAAIAIVAFALFARKRPRPRTAPAQAMTQAPTVTPKIEPPPSPPAPLPPTKAGLLKTRTRAIDEALRGGIPKNSAVLLLSGVIEAVDGVITDILESSCQQGLVTVYVTSRERDSISKLLDQYRNLHVLVTHSVAESMYEGKTNVYRSRLELNQINSARLEMEKGALGDPGSKVVVIDILSALILSSSAKAVRFWISDLIEKLKKRNATILAHLNPDVVPKEDVRILAEVFDGEIEILEVVEQAARFAVVRRMTEHEYKREPVRLD